MRAMRPALLGALLGLCLSTACTSVIATQQSPDLKPRKVTTSLPIGLNPLLFNVSRGEVVGGEATEPDGHYDQVFEWNENFRLNRHAFLKPLREELTGNGFRFAVGSKAAYQLKATVERLVFNVFPTHGEADVDVLWAFEGPNSLEVRTRGYGKVEGEGKAALYQAFRISLRNLLARDEIIARFAPKGLPVAEDTPEPRRPPQPHRTEGQEPEEPPDPPRPAAVDRVVPIVAQSDVDLDDASLDARVTPSVVTLLARDRWSSGVVLDENGLVITSSFLVAGVGYVNLVLHDGVTRAARVLMVDKDRGLALVQSVSSGRFVAAPIRMDPLPRETAITAYGTPYHPALSISLARGTIRDTTQNEVETDVNVVAGNAGGPVVDRRGRVVGIIIWTHERTSQARRAVAVPMKTAFEALRLTHE